MRILRRFRRSSFFFFFFFSILLSYQSVFRKIWRCHTRPPLSNRIESSNSNSNQLVLLRTPSHGDSCYEPHSLRGPFCFVWRKKGVRVIGCPTRVVPPPQALMPGSARIVPPSHTPNTLLPPCLDDDDCGIEICGRKTMIVVSKYVVANAKMVLLLLLMLLPFRCYRFFFCYYCCTAAGDEVMMLLLLL